VGAPMIGGVWIFISTSNGWILQGPKLLASDGSTFVTQGFSVALSSSGDTAAFGGPSDTHGAVWVFRRNLSATIIWQQDGNKLTNSSGGKIGYSIALSSAGDIIATGGPSQNNVGAGWIFQRIGTNWVQQGPLVGTGVAPSSTTSGYLQGVSVALSSDGNTLVIGGSGDNLGTGALWIFVQNGGQWTQQGSKLFPTDSVSGNAVGTSVSISGSGQLVVVGGPDGGGSNGYTWIFNDTTTPPPTTTGAPTPTPTGQSSTPTPSSPKTPGGTPVNSTNKLILGIIFGILGFIVLVIVAYFGHKKWQENYAPVPGNPHNNRCTIL